MKKVKTILSILTASLIIIQLAACSIPSGESAVSDTSAENQTAEQAIATKAETVPAPEPAEPSFDYVTSLEANMSLEEKVGQMFFACCPSDEAIESASKYSFGGYVLFAANFEGKTADEVKEYIQKYTYGAKFPMLVGVDEEGGDVVRVSSNPNLRATPFLSPKEYYKNGGIDAAIAAEEEKANLLLSLGINVNLAPVCDVTKNESSFMYSRSVSSDTTEVCNFVTKAVDVYNSKGAGCVLKHFPGYGDNTDTHTGSATDNRSYTELVNNDFLPFEAGIKAGANAVMVSHNIVTSIDPDYPASLSDKVHQVLRQDLNFKGVIMTDDLIMEAIGQYTGSENAAVLAVKGGNDLLCCTDFENQYPAVIAAVENGEIPIEQIDQSVIRILKWKQDLGILGF